MTSIESEVCELLAEVSGRNYATVFTACEISRKIFEGISNDSHEFIHQSTTEDLQAALDTNHAWLKEEGDSPPCSVFACCDLFNTQAIANYVGTLHSKIRRVVKSPEQVRFVPLGTQHCTLFTEQRGSGTADVADHTFKRYSDFTSDCEPFDLVVRGPHLAKDGGIILEIEACSPEPLRIKEHAKAIPTAEGRVVNPIMFSTVGYLLRASTEEAQRLLHEFADERRKQVSMRARIRGLRVAISLNRLTVGLPHYLSFRPIAERNMADLSAAKLLTRLSDLAERPAMDSFTREVLLNEVSAWLEHPSGPRSLAAATSLFEKCAVLCENRKR